ncbi:flagellar hook-associated protein FlgL [Virgibacillus sp. 179-BFC.A HS]|uniref:Flagellar hook-associated protein FlgL n=1 Tax=Tigheibacillus jepli TaxID=3035914 RepID=A0ABU5CFK3_9BACI|nr:flagellar hook-associated protein FlgL [Virgibacillus sp. 179-BFC.A HS]MDY0405088.1 flagellar hook-associated protein FlgL [Virgibacillus sp. 179-BFC.A HS]
MRVTQNMLSQNMLNNLSNNYSNLGKYLDQLNTGKKVNVPSDDPVVAMKGIGYRSQVARIEQFTRNAGEVRNWMDSSDAALDKATKALQKLRELAVQASTDTLGADERKSIKKEAEQLKEHLVDIANTNVNGKYIFNGTDINEKPFKIENDKVIGIDKLNTKPVVIEVAEGTKLQANVNPKEMFGTSDDDSMFADIQKFIDALDDGNEAIEKSIGVLDNRIDDIINARADLGARSNRLDLIEDRLSEQEIVATKMMSKNEDVDYEKVITQFLTQESILRASLSAGAKTIQPSLLDFLR